jgi:hypothetical protein
MEWTSGSSGVFALSEAEVAVAERLSLSIEKEQG